MKPLSKKEIAYRKLVFAAVKDYFGEEYKNYYNDVYGHAIIHRTFKVMSAEDKVHLLHIMANLADPTYKKTLKV